MSTMQYAAPRPLSPLLRLFPIRTLASDTEELKDGEVLVKCCFMTGETHLAAIADSHLSSVIALFAGHIAGVYYERIHLSVDCDEIVHTCPMKKVKELLEMTHGVVDVLVKDPPKETFFDTNRTDLLIPHYAQPNRTLEGW